MTSARARWALAIGGGLLLGALLFATPLLATTTVSLHAGGSGFMEASARCDAAIERAGEPTATWSARLEDGLRFVIPIPDGLGERYGYRVEVLGNASYAPAGREGLPMSQQRTSESMCVAREDPAMGGSPGGSDFVAQGNGAIYAAFWAFRAP